MTLADILSTHVCSPACLFIFKQSMNKIQIQSSEIREGCNTNIYKVFTFGKLEICIERLNHAAFILTLSCHILSRIQKRLHPTKHKNQQLTITKHEKEDIQIWKNLLATTRQGILMNSIMHCYSSKVVI